ncbi:hypothetical protein CJ179_30730 [Rhodococcus sp. ACS1]|uniref:DUF6907 domain-containing protein n=1 Tax=Rhodococcus TaxID=1827 RepID=UPI000BB11793|nr:MULTISPECIES: hypothetical protein [Rhodococcus]PBC45089.1 hypothetical protein CJ179_30730 [Rhodococcus sp. ACS1]QSE78183.1 hypothetical protein JWS14_02935 [Rhodococcus koreensis]QYB08233.1 hypothetical protein I1A62_08850 [Rhodococcus sp. USK10]
MNTNQTTGTECAPWCTNEDARGRTDHTCMGDSSDCIELTAALDYLTLDEDGIESSFCFVTPVREADRRPGVSMTWEVGDHPEFRPRLTPGEARRIAAELVAAADLIEGGG